MNPPERCPDCGAPLTRAGFCPRCVFSSASQSRPASASPGNLAAGEAGAAGAGTFGPFDQLEPLSEQGAMGIVYRARHRPTKRIVALKLLRSDHLVSEEKVNRFQREVEAMAKLDHRGILPVYEVGRHHGQPYFSMKLVEAGSLKEQMRAGRWQMGPEGPRAWQHRVAALLEAVARAVHHAHQRGILHRDLKPANILVDDQEQPFVTDFGLAKFIETGPDVTRGPVFLGTPDYSSPEQAGGRSGDLTTATDIWGIGVMLYELLTGTTPFMAENSAAVLEQIQRSEPRRPRLLRRAVDPDLETICLKCLDKEPARRYGSAQALAADLARYRRGEPIEARPVSEGERLWKWVRRRPVLAGWVGATGLALVLGLAGTTWQWRRATALARREAETAAQAQLVVAKHLRNQDAPLEELDKLALAVGIAPHSPVAVQRLISALTFRNYALPLRSFGPSPTDTNRVIAARFSPEGRRLVTLTLAGSLQVWDAQTGLPVGPELPHAGHINLLGFSPSGAWVFSASGSSSPFGSAELRLWRVGSTEPPLALAHLHGLLDVRFQETEGRLITADPWTVRRWALDRAEVEDQVGLLAVSALALSPDANQFAVAVGGLVPAEVTLREFPSGGSIAEPQRTGSMVSSLAYAPDGNRLLAACSGGHLQVWQLPDATLLASGQLSAKLTDGRLNRDGTRALVSDGQSSWLFASTNLAQPLAHYADRSFTAGKAFTPDGTRFVLTAQTEARFYRATDGRADAEPLAVGWWIEDTDLDATGGRLALAASQPHAVIYDVRPGSAVPNLVAWPAGETLKALSPDGAVAAFVVGDSTLCLRETRTGRALGPLHRHPGPVQQVALGFTPSRVASICAVNGTNQEVRVWQASDAAAPEGPLPIRVPNPRLAWSHAGHHLVIAGANTGIVVVVSAKGLTTWEFDVARDAPLDAQVGGDATYDVAFSPDDRRFAIATYGRGAQVWNCQTRAREHLLPHAAPVSSLAFSPDGTRLATGAFDGMAQVWRLPEGTPAGAPFPHLKPLSAVRFARGGRDLITGTLEGQLAAWDLESNRLQFECQAHADMVVQLELSESRPWLATLGKAGDLRGWDLTSGLEVSEPIDAVPLPRGFRLAAGGAGLWAPAAATGLRYYALPAIPTPAPSWLEELGHDLAGPPRARALPRLLGWRARFARAADRDFFDTWAAWFFGDRDTRPGAPW